MRVRTLLMAACMVCVPMLAMFSHHIPPQVTSAARTMLWVPLAEWAGGQPPARSRPMVDASPLATLEAAAATAADAAPAPRAAPAPAHAAVTAAASGRPRAAERRAVEDRLVQLGAKSIACQPLPGGSGELLATCRVDVDAAGQLQRLFQAAGADPSAALERLAEEVTAWRMRDEFRSKAEAGF